MHTNKTVQYVLHEYIFRYHIHKFLIKSSRDLLQSVNFYENAPVHK